MKHLSLTLAFVLAAVPALAQDLKQDLTPRQGWAVHPTDKPYGDLVQAVTAAIKANGLAVVTQAGPTGAAARRGITLPGNRVIGAFNNDFAVRILEHSTAAMIEAPVRFYVTENPDGTATLSYKTPSFVFAPYHGDDTPMAGIAAELDQRFDAVARAALQ